VDNTFLQPNLPAKGPWNRAPTWWSKVLTKYLNGHSDVLGGMIVVKDAELYRRIKRVLTLFGATMDPHQAWLILRGVRTLPLRMEKAPGKRSEAGEVLKPPPQGHLGAPPRSAGPATATTRQRADGWDSGARMTLLWGFKEALTGGGSF